MLGYREILQCNGTLSFSSSNAEITTNYREPPCKIMFKDKLTKLIITVTVKSGNVSMQKEIIQNRWKFKRGEFQSLSHGCFTAANRTPTSHYVGNTRSLPSMFDPAWTLLFAFVGLSLPYRWFIYFKVDHVTFRVFELASPTPPLSADEQILSATTDSASMQMTVPVGDVVSCSDMY